ncbi:putative transcription factor Nin-like family [Helianthus annuus]|nr:putative transcription factor Nin-like family [Helianthus annuus]
MEYPSPTKDKPMGFWASPRAQMDGSAAALDGFSRPDDPFNGFSELMNFDTYAGWCTSPTAADQMLASFALSGGYAPFDYSNFTEQVKGGFVGNDVDVLIERNSIYGGDFVVPGNSNDSNDENGGCCQQKKVEEIGNGVVYRSPSTSLAEKMLKALSLVKDSSGAGILAQVWVPIKEGDRYVLSTCEQPYLLDQALAGYREVSRGFTFSADAKPGNFRGLPGRVFTSKVPEWTSNVAHYNKCEYLRIDHALSHDIRGSIAVPVFENGLFEKSCCAVLELVTMKEKADFNAEIDQVCRALETVNLKSGTPPRLHEQCLSKNQLAALAEIADVLRAVCHAHSLPVALTWIPCSLNEQVGFCNGLDENQLSTTSDHVSVNVTDQPVSGSKRQSEKKRSSSEKNVSLSVLQQYFSGSLKDAAKAIGVCPTTLKRICRQHGISRWPSRKINKVNRSLKKIQTVLDSVQGVEGALKFDPTTGGLVAASGVIQDLDAQKGSVFSNNTPEGGTSPSPCFNNESPIVKLEDECYMGVGKLKLKSSTSLPVTTSVNEFWSPVKPNPVFTSQSLGSMPNGDDMDTSMIDDHDHNESTSSGMTESSHGSMMNGSSSSSPSFSGLKNRKSKTLSCDEGSKLIVKATYKEDTVRFKFEPTSGWFQLYEEVAKRFKMQTGTFQLKYKDDEEEWVLLVCESDWNECLEVLEFLGTRTVKFIVCDATFATGSSGSSNCFLVGSS